MNEHISITTKYTLMNRKTINTHT